MCRPSSWVNDPYPTGRATGQVLAFCEISKCVNATLEGIREVLKCPLGAEKFFKFKLTQTLRQPVKLRMSLHYAEIPMVTDNYINLVQFNLSRVFRVTWYHFSIVPTGNEVRIWRDWKKKKKAQWFTLFLWSGWENAYLLEICKYFMQIQKCTETSQLKLPSQARNRASKPWLTRWLVLAIIGEFKQRGGQRQRKRHQKVS